MRHGLVWAGCISISAVLAVFWQTRTREEPALFDPAVRHIEPAPLCPWREPAADLHGFFPGATDYVTETRILSGFRVELAQRLGRVPEPEENGLTLHGVFAGAEKVGVVLTRRVKGEHGGIELVLALNQRGEVQGVRLQRLREPESVAKWLQSPEWLGLFRGRLHNQGWGSDDVRSLPGEARISAQAIREGIRSLLILLAASESTGAPLTRKPHH